MNALMDGSNSQNDDWSGMEQGQGLVFNDRIHLRNSQADSGLLRWEHRCRMGGAVDVPPEWGLDYDQRNMQVGIWIDAFFALAGIFLIFWRAQ